MHAEEEIDLGTTHSLSGWMDGRCYFTEKSEVFSTLSLSLSLTVNQTSNVA